MIAAGERGTILLSDNYGTSWRQANVPVSVSLTGVRFINERTGWAVGHLGVVLRSDDGGQNWGKQLDGREAARLIFASAQAKAASSATPESQKTLSDAQQFVADGPDKPFLDLWFQNDQLGYIVGAYSMMLRTTDGGKTWQPWQDHINGAHGLHLYAISASGGTLYLAGEQGSLFFSTDQGQSFNPMPSPYKGSFFGTLATGPDALLAYGLRGNTFWSGDQGKHWNKVESGIATSFSAATQLANGRLALASQAGDILFSDDQGQTLKRGTGVLGFPIAAMDEAADGSIIVAGLRGLRRISSTTLAVKP